MRKVESVDRGNNKINLTNLAIQSTVNFAFNEIENGKADYQAFCILVTDLRPNTER